MKLILASTSPNRRELFDRMGVEYQAVAPDYEENIDKHSEPFQQVQMFAWGKAESVQKRVLSGEIALITSTQPPTSDYLVMGFDSMIEFEGGSVGKAEDQTEAKEFLQSFVGKPQQIVTGFALLGRYKGKDFSLTDYQSTPVKFRKNITDVEIDHYLNFGDWQGKCGAYSILGPGVLFLEELNGDFQNIIGVPVIKIGQRLHEEFGVSWMGLLEPQR